MKQFVITLVLFSITDIATAQNQALYPTSLNRLLQTPRSYCVLKTQDKITIDGIAQEKAWKKAPWTELFTDILSGEKSNVMGSTRCKLLWDDQFLYVFAQLKETNIYAFIRAHDQPVFQENAFELFINPNGTTHNYFEFQINALGTTCDIFLPKPYRNGGLPLISWDLKGIKKAIHLRGTLNDPSDHDTSWSIELAIPFSSIVMNKKQYPQPGIIWRINLSRVERRMDIINEKYTPKKDKEGQLLPELYTVWTPQGIVNLHYPERWGYILFSDKSAPAQFLSDKNEKLKLLLWRYYYLQHNYKDKYGHYASSIKKLNRAFPRGASPKNSNKLHMESTKHQFWIQCEFPALHKRLSVNQDSEIQWQN